MICDDPKKLVHFNGVGDFADIVKKVRKDFNAILDFDQELKVFTLVPCVGYSGRNGNIPMFGGRWTSNYVLDEEGINYTLINFLNTFGCVPEDTCW